MVRTGRRIHIGLKGGKPERNLMTAFAGESEARSKHTSFASAAGEEGLGICPVCVQPQSFFEVRCEND